MQAFIETQILDLKRTPNVRMPRPSQCLMVSKVAARSLAQDVGVGLRDFLVSLDGVSAHEVSPDTYLLQGRERKWTFYSRPRHEQIDLHATGIEPGVVLKITPDGVKERYQPKVSSPVELEILWEAKDYKALEDLSRKTLSARGKDHPALAFLGGALFETNRKPEGIALIQEYAKSYASHWTMNFSGIAFYYLALDLLARGEKDNGLRVLHGSFKHNPCPRIADLIEKQTGERPPLETPNWLGRQFPDYTLPRLDHGSGSVSLKESLAALNDEQVLAVCLLATYRGNGPYSEFMKRYLNYATWFLRFLPGLHVITMEAEMPKEHAYYLRGEESVRAAGLPMELLLEDGGLSGQVRQFGSPYIVLLDRQGVVRYEGELDAVGLWDTLAAIKPG